MTAFIVNFFTLSLIGVSVLWIIATKKERQRIGFTYACPKAWTFTVQLTSNWTSWTSGDKFNWIEKKNDCILFFNVLKPVTSFVPHISVDIALKVYGISFLELKGWEAPHTVKLLDLSLQGVCRRWALKKIWLPLPYRDKKFTARDVFHSIGLKQVMRFA